MAEPTRPRSQRILVVDDHLDNTLLMRELLTRQGYEGSVAENAAVAEEIMRQTPPDLVLLDVIMPGKSGYELCREWKDAPETRLIPVVMITGLSDLEDKIRGIEAGADDFLNKPIFPVELFARVASLLRVKDYTDELENADTVLCTLGRSVESRDPYTEGHCERLARLRQRARTLHGPGRRRSTGAAPRRLSARPGQDRHRRRDSEKAGTALRPTNGASCGMHPVIGENICKPLRSLRLVLPIIRHHHEHWNGTGYPDRLAGEAIPLLARILQVVDVYDALRTERPYKPAHSHQSARETMRAEAAAACGTARSSASFSP